MDYGSGRINAERRVEGQNEHEAHTPGVTVHFGAHTPLSKEEVTVGPDGLVVVNKHRDDDDDDFDCFK
jgi:hypothetical protein